MFENYLLKRKQYVEFDDSKSDILDINTGVPQGSILGPLLFIIYINDIANVSDIFYFIIYADNNTLHSILSLFNANRDSTYTENNINKELSKIFIHG